MQATRTRILSLFVFMGFISPVFSQKADIILFNGKIFTADTSRLYVQALAIKGNKILATGNNTAMVQLAAPDTKRIDLMGRTVVPGFNDQHDHAPFKSPIRLQYDYQAFDWDGLSRAAVLDSITKLLPQAKAGEWITGAIGNKVCSDTGMRRLLDSIAPHNPVVLQVWWGHGIVTNQKGLEAAGLNDTLEDPVGGWYVRNGDGKIAVVQENAEAPFWIAANRLNPGAVVQLMEAFGQEQLRGGITTTSFMGTGFTQALAIEVLKKAKIPQRLRIVAWPRTTPEGRQLFEWPVAAMQPTPMSRISGIKYLINHLGPLNYPVDTIRNILQEALTTKRQLMMHISGDSVFARVLGLIKASGTAEQWRPLRVRIEHNMIGDPTAGQRRLLRDYGILVMHTPVYNHGSLLRSLLKDGIMVGMSPDAGFTNPFRDLLIITRQQHDPAENISLEQAVIAFTKTNAYAEFKENEKGTLTKGMLADLVVLSQDIFTVPADQLPATTSVLTMIDGKIVYQQKGLTSRIEVSPF